MKKISNYLQQQDLVDHAKYPHNYGTLNNPSFVSGEHNPSCGDSIQLFGRIAHDRLVDITFEGRGCMLSLAMASKFTDYVKNMQLDEIVEIEEDLIEELLGVALGPNRMQCGMLPILALQSGIVNYKKSL